MGVIVIAVLVTLAEHLCLPVLEEVVQVVLYHGRARCEIALGELVYVQVVVPAKEVIHDLVVLGAVPFQVDSAVKCEPVLGPPLDRAGEVDIVLVCPAFLDRVLGAAPVLGDVVVVDIVETVPVHVPCTVDIVLPGLGGPCRFFYVNSIIIRVFHIEIARQIAVVVRPRVRGVVPVKGRVAVLSGTVQEGGGRLQAVTRGGGVFENHHRLVGLADTGVAHLAVLVAPIGVVGVASYQVIHFLGRGVLRTALTRGGEYHESELVCVIELLLHGSVISE